MYSVRIRYCIPSQSLDGSTLVKFHNVLFLASTPEHVRRCNLLMHVFSFLFSPLFAFIIVEKYNLSFAPYLLLPQMIKYKAIFPDDHRYKVFVKS